MRNHRRRPAAGLAGGSFPAFFGAGERPYEAVLEIRSPRDANWSNGRW